MSEETIQNRLKTLLLANYDIEINELEKIDGGYQSDETYVLINRNRKKFVVKYVRSNEQEFNRLKTMVRFESYLAEEVDVQCAKIISTRSGVLDFYSDEDQRYLFVEEYLAGKEPSEENFQRNPSLFEQLGSLLSKIHLSSDKYVSQHFGDFQNIPQEFSIQ